MKDLQYLKALYQEAIFTKNFKDEVYAIKIFNKLFPKIEKAVKKGESHYYYRTYLAPEISTHLERILKTKGFYSRKMSGGTLQIWGWAQ